MLLPHLALLAVALLVSACDDSKADAPGKFGEPKPTQTEAPSRPALDGAAAKRATSALASVSEAQRSTVAGRALFELEGGRIPASASTLLESLPGLPPGTIGHAIAKAFSEPELLAELDALCSGKGRDAMQALAMAAPEEKVGGIWATCGLERVGLMTAPEASAVPPMPMLLAHVLAWHLEEGGGVADDERILLRALAGAPPS